MKTISNNTSDQSGLIAQLIAKRISDTQMSLTQLKNQVDRGSDISKQLPVDLEMTNEEIRAISQTDWSMVTTNQYEKFTQRLNQLNMRKLMLEQSIVISGPEKMKMLEVEITADQIILDTLQKVHKRLTSKNKKTIKLAA